MARVFTITEGLENLGALKTGGQGSVYKGRRTGTIFTAIKILPTPIHSESAADKNYTSFLNEVAKLKRVNEEPNPNVVKILSSGITESGSLPFIEMEYIDGPDLEELLRPPQERVFTIKEAMKVADQLSGALAHCHRVEVKHGDIKSNNVKYNLHSGNYVLLDFGLAMLSDEQRRTSLRHAGAVEFMAPEQHEGKLLFESDVYSFGVILFELLAGVAPFPLQDSSEMSRNRVMLAHLEAPVPDLIALRRQNMPESWSEEKRAAEAQIPAWLLQLLERCLQKKPEQRFAGGVALHEAVADGSIRTGHAPGVDSGSLVQLQEEISRLRAENERLKELATQRERQEVSWEPAAGAQTPASYDGRKTSLLVYFIPLLVLVGLAYYFLIRKPAAKELPKPVTEASAQVLGEYKVLAARAYFYDGPDAGTKRNAYMVPSSDVVKALKESGDFVYTEFTNGRGQTSRGWLRKADLVPLGQWTEAQNVQVQQNLEAEAIRQQLAQARSLLSKGQTEAALAIYNALSQKEIPEAMYEAGNLGIQRRNSETDCAAGYELVKRASSRGWVPAKRTLGFLYVFADNPDVLRLNGYENCAYERNVFRGTRLLKEAVAGGDSTAERLLGELQLLPQDSTGQ